MAITAAEYEFVLHDSYIDCVDAHEMDQSEIESQILADTTRIKGFLNQHSIDDVRIAVGVSPNLTPRLQSWILAALPTA